MIGGKVIETRVVDDRIWIDVQDTTYPKDFCAIYVERNEDSESIKRDGRVWWQGRYVMWTGDHGEDVKIPRRSYSGVGIPSNYFE